MRCRCHGGGGEDLGLALAAGALLVAMCCGCSPVQRAEALAGIGAAGCGTGLAAEAAGEDWGAIVQAAGCWLADWAAERLERLRNAELEAEALGELEALDAAAVELSEARALLLADPCEANAERAREALAECERLRREGEP